MSQPLTLPSPPGGEGTEGTPSPPGGEGWGEGDTNSVASQSSSSGWLGPPPCEPKPSAVSPTPAPKCSCQARLTATRAVSGLAGSTSQRANPRRLFGTPFGSGG